MDEDNQPCAWLYHEHILEDLPILNITDGTLKNRLTKLRKMELITSKTIANENTQGSRTYYRTTSLLYDMLFETTSLKNDVIEEPRHSKMTSNTLTNSNTKVNKNNSKELLQNQEFQFGKQKPKKENLYTKCLHMIDDKIEDADPINRKLLIDWFDMLLEKYKGRGKVLYANIFKGKLNMLDKYDKADWAEIISYNLQRGYEGFYPIPISNYSSGLKNESGARNVPTMTEEDYRKEAEHLAELEAQGVQVRF